MGRKLKSCTTRSSKSPSFFKVMIGDYFDEKLRVPTAFIRHFNGNLPHKSILKSPNGSSWPIQVKKIGSDLFFSNGWQAFVNGHCLEFGDFLVFKYNDGKSRFSVKIYGRTGCEKEVHLNHEEPIISSTKKEKKGGNTETRQMSMGIERKVGAASPIEAKLPHFSAMSLHSRRYHMTVRRAFVKEIGLDTKNNILLQDPYGKSWPVNISKRSDGRIDMTDGWAQFYRGNKVAVGDTFLFVFNGRLGDTVRVRVRIFRAAEGVKTGRRFSKRSSAGTLNFSTYDDSTDEEEEEEEEEEEN